MASERVNRLQTGIPVRSLLRKNAPDSALRGRASKRSSKPLCTRAVVSSDFQSRARDLGALRRFAAKAKGIYKGRPVHFRPRERRDRHLAMLRSRARDAEVPDRLERLFDKPTFRGATWAICAPGEPGWRPF